MHSPTHTHRHTHLFHPLLRLAGLCPSHLPSVEGRGPSVQQVVQSVKGMEILQTWQMGQSRRKKLKQVGVLHLLLE